MEVKFYRKKLGHTEKEALTQLDLALIGGACFINEILEKKEICYGDYMYFLKYE